MTWVDPRVCGGDLSGVGKAFVAFGRSPRVRGGRSIPTSASISTRSIPACAGGTALGSSVPCIYRVDPRVCGGDPVSTNGVPVYQGRSPRVRGGLVIRLFKGIL